MTLIWQDEVDALTLVGRLQHLHIAQEVVQNLSEREKGQAGRQEGEAGG